MRSAAVLPLVAALVAAPLDARGDVQGNAGLVVGAAAAGDREAFADHAELQLGLRGDVMFGRRKPSDFGLGPFVEVGTFAFDELQVGGGVTALLPVHPTLPLVLSAGAFGRYGDDDFGFEPGISAALFWGTRSYNFHEGYIMSAGLLVGYRHSLGDSRESLLHVGAQLDLLVLGLPLVALVNLLRGPTSAAAPLAR